MGRTISSRPRSNNMGQCKKHPKHRQTPGVCSVCLSEKLSKVVSNNTSSSRYTARSRPYYCSSSSLSSSDDDDDSYASSYASPLHHHHDGGGGGGHHRRIISDVNNSDRDQGLFIKKKVISSGFWSKFFCPRIINRGHVHNHVHADVDDHRKVLTSSMVVY